MLHDQAETAKDVIPFLSTKVVALPKQSFSFSFSFFAMMRVVEVQAFAGRPSGLALESLRLRIGLAD